LPVRRLFLNLSNASDPARWEYDNPWIEAHLTEYLAEEKPDIFHLISGYLMTAGAIRAVKCQGIPVTLTLTDFWFLCHRVTLYRTSGTLCVENSSLDCVRCLVEQKRRFRLPAQKTPAVTDNLWWLADSLHLVAPQVAKIDERRQTLQAALAEVNVAVCPSNFLKQVYIDKGFQAKQMRFIRQGVNIAGNGSLKKSPSTCLRIGYIGQIAVHKGVQVLIEAFLKLISSKPEAEQALPQIQLKLYGDVAKFPAFYRELAAQHSLVERNGYIGSDQLGDQLQFFGAFEHHQMTQVYAGIDVLVVPSIWYENSPNVILEAFAHQTPVIASDLGGMAELVDDQKTGLLFVPNDAVDLARKLETLLNDPGLLTRLQGNIVSPETLETEMAELLLVYQSVMTQQVNSRK
jgi:glycosyltransferase involved in cell wall biosynthesis